MLHEYIECYRMSHKNVESIVKNMIYYKFPTLGT